MFDKLDKKISGKEEAKQTPLSSLFDMAREYGCAGDLLGREYEVYDRKGDLLYKVVQKPMKSHKVIALISELDALREIEKQNIKNSKNGKK